MHLMQLTVSGKSLTLAALSETSLPLMICYGTHQQAVPLRKLVRAMAVLPRHDAPLEPVKIAAGYKG